MRLFIAINLSAEMKKALTDAQSEMYRRGVRGNFTPEQNLHLTLAFIGEYAQPQSVLEALEGFRFAPFLLELDRCGSFGELWWAGLKSSPALESLVRRLRHSLSERAIPFDRKRFSPHITLVRRASAAQPVKIEPRAMMVETICLMRSDRGKNGMIYTEVGRIEAE